MSNPCKTRGEEPNSMFCICCPDAGGCCDLQETVPGEAKIFSGAAPEMLAALLKCEEVLTIQERIQNIPPSPLLRQVRAAIKSATNYIEAKENK